MWSHAEHSPHCPACSRRGSLEKRWPHKAARHSAGLWCLPACQTGHVPQKGLLVQLWAWKGVPTAGSSVPGCAQVTSSTVAAFESDFVWFNIQHSLLRLGTIISIYSQKPGKLFVKRQSNKSSMVCKIQTFVLQVKYLDRNHYWVLLQQPCQRKRERGLGKKTQRR